jgi:hypothetical protein
MLSRHCPNCLSVVVLRSRRRGPIEAGLKLFWMYPYRCRECSHRFFRFRPPILTELRRVVRKSSWKTRLIYIFGFEEHR